MLLVVFMGVIVSLPYIGLVREVDQPVLVRAGPSEESLKRAQSRRLILAQRGWEFG